jgi:exosome complex component RRP41
LIFSRTSELQHTITSALESIIQTHLYPHSTITINLHVLALDGGLLAALINASTLALIDAGIPMSDYLIACTAGVLASTTISSKAAPRAPRIPGLSVSAAVDDVDDPLLDLSGLEEQEVPFVTIGIVEEGKVSVCVCETRVEMSRFEEMVAVSVDGCKAVKKILDGVIRAHGKRMLEDG